MARTVLILVVLAALAGGVYAVTRPSAPDPEATAVAEALAVHTKALKTAMDEKCTEARAKLRDWNRLRKAGTPSPDDTKDARKMVRKIVKGGCVDPG
jgi:hypothetical protein